MSFLFPLCLLGLIGIPIVIIIYILQSKYNEQTVTSTYIWHLSDKFMKKKNPFSGLTGLISLLLQILTIAAISFAIARPIFILPNAAYDYCFVLDASGSMNIKNGNKTRFNLAKEEIVDLIKSSADGSAYTLVSVSSESTLVFENVNSKDAAIEAVKNLSPAYESHEFSKIYEAAQNRFQENNSEIIYVLTDKAYEEYENVEVIDLSGGDVENYALSDVSGGLTGGVLTANGSVSSYMKNTDLEIKLYVDGAKTESATQIVSAKKGKATEFEISCPCENYSSFEVVITESDACVLDNSVTYYNLKSESKVYSTLVIGDFKEYETGFYYKAIFDAISDFEVTVISSDEYKENTEKYAKIFRKYKKISKFLVELADER